MRIYQIVAIRDIQADVFNPPIFIDTTGAAIREFHDLCQNKDTVYGRHPEQFELWHIGVYNDEKGVLAPFGLDSDARRQLAAGTQILN